MFYKNLLIVLASASSCFGMHSENHREKLLQMAVQKELTHLRKIEQFFMQSETPKERLSPKAVQEELARLRKMEEQGLPIYSNQLAPEVLEAIHKEWDKVAEQGERNSKKLLESVSPKNDSWDPIRTRVQGGDPTVARSLFEKRNLINWTNNAEGTLTHALEENIVTFIANEDQSGFSDLLKNTLEIIFDSKNSLPRSEFLDYISEETMKKVVYKGTPANVEAFLLHCYPNHMLFEALAAANIRLDSAEMALNRRDWDTRLTSKKLKKNLHDAALSLKIIATEHQKRLIEHWDELERKDLFAELPENPYEDETSIKTIPTLANTWNKGKTKLEEDSQPGKSVPSSSYTS